MEGIVVIGRLRVDHAVRSRDEEQSVRSEEASNQGQQLVVRRDVLDDLEADDQVERFVGEVAELENRSPSELEVVEEVIGGGMVDRHGIELDPEHVLCPLGEDRRPVALPGAEVEHLHSVG